MTVFIRFCFGASVGFIVGPVVWTAYILIISLIWPGLEVLITAAAIAGCVNGVVCGAIIGIYDVGLGKGALISYSIIPAFFVFVSIVAVLVAGIAGLFYAVIYAGASVVVTLIPALITGFLVSDINYRVTSRYLLRHRRRMLRRV